MANAMRALAAELEFSDVDGHFGELMARLSGRDDTPLRLAAALASRATGRGDVCVHLEEFAGRVIHASLAPRGLGPGGGEQPAFAASSSNGVPRQLTLPRLDEWVRVLRQSPVVGDPGAFRPLVLDPQNRLYLYRYWDYETRLAENLLARAAAAEHVDETVLRDGLARYFPDAQDIEQKVAAAMAIMRRFCVISGGPGTGKTTTVVKILALLAEQVPGRKLAIGLAAPTGKAAARVQDAIRAAIDRLGLDARVRDSIPGEASTLHRLLGARPGSVHFRRGASNPLSLDVLVVDEASMADLALAAKLVEALPPNARLILLGDKDQLASVEAGAVLGDICAHSGVSPEFAKRLAAVTATPGDLPPRETRSDAVGRISPAPPARGSATDDGSGPLSDSIALLDRSYRFGPESGIGTLARLVNEGRGAEAMRLLESATHEDLAWRAIPARELRAALAHTAVEGLRPYFEAVWKKRDPATVFERFDTFRVLCARRTGLLGVAWVNRMIEDALEDERLISTRETWYAGRPVMVTRNDYNLRLFNGDVGIALPDAEGRLKVFFAGGEAGLRAFAPSRVPEHETVYAMTIHKSQGSEFDRVLMILPEEPSPIMSRELVYTGITRAMKHVEIWGNGSVFAEAVEHRLVRASALQERLWGSHAR